MVPRRQRTLKELQSINLSLTSTDQASNFVIYIFLSSDDFLIASDMTKL